MVDVPTPIRRPAEMSRRAAAAAAVAVGAVVVAVTGRVRVEVVTGRGRLGGVGGAVVRVVVGAGWVPTPATGGTLKERLNSSISWFKRVGSTGPVNSATKSVKRVSKGGGDEAEPTPAGDRVGVSMRADHLVRCPPSLCRR